MRHYRGERGFQNFVIRCSNEGCVNRPWKRKARLIRTFSVSPAVQRKKSILASKLIVPGEIVLTILQCPFKIQAWVEALSLCAILISTSVSTETSEDSKVVFALVKIKYGKHNRKARFYWRQPEKPNKNRTFGLCGMCVCSKSVWFLQIK